jgi:hypothetical protein
MTMTRTATKQQQSKPAGKPLPPMQTWVKVYPYMRVYDTFGPMKKPLRVLSVLPDGVLLRNDEGEPFKRPFNALAVECLSGSTAGALAVDACANMPADPFYEAANEVVMFKHYLSEKMRRIIERHPDLAKDVEECIEAVESSFREAFLTLTDASTNNRESFIASHPDGGQMNEQTVQLSDTEAA